MALRNRSLCCRDSNKHQNLRIGAGLAGRRPVRGIERHVIAATSVSACARNDKDSAPNAESPAIFGALEVDIGRRNLRCVSDAKKGSHQAPFYFAVTQSGRRW